MLEFARPMLNLKCLEVAVSGIAVGGIVATAAAGVVAAAGLLWPSPSEE